MMKPDGSREMVVLVVDREPATREATRRALSELPSAIALDCGDPAFAVRAARTMLPTVVLARGAGDESLALARRLRDDAETRAIPIVLRSTPGELSAAAAFAAGASDYCTSTLAWSEVVARLRFHSASFVRQKEAGEAYATLRESKLSLLRKITELERLSSVDSLTGLSNRRYFDEFTTMQWKRAIREGHPFSILMIDVDDFKRYNDTYGHLAGDKVLKQIGEAVQKCCARPGDLVARFGGEEFVVSSRAPLEGASTLGERLCRAVENIGIPHSGATAAGRVTISIGGATARPRQGEPYLPLLEAADVALYEAKLGGKNRAVLMATETWASRVRA